MNNTKLELMIINSMKFLTRKFIKNTSLIKHEGSGVAIIVPLPSKNCLSDDEIISIRHLTKYLGLHSIFFIAPKGCKIDLGNHTKIFISKRYFGSAFSHGKLLKSIRFYKLFRNFKYILFYHLDSLVFSSDLNRWCDRNFDYIGAPWLQCIDSPWVAHSRIGNGGFALLKVKSAVRILSKYYQTRPLVYWIESLNALNIIFFLEKNINLLSRTGCTLGARLTKLKKYLNDQLLNQNNDIFWSDVATRLDPSFHVASFEDGISFAFEVCPEDCFVINNHKLPFGCHAWNKYHKHFWDTYILK